MEPDRGRLTAIRLPLQIGTSALWSLARTSAGFPGLVLLGLGIWLMIKLIGEKSGLLLGFVVAAAGGALVFYAVVHARLAMKERPSDVLLDARGLRIEGGPRHGLSLQWTEIEPGRCQIRNEVEERLALWRIIVNMPLVAITLASEGGSDITINPMTKTPITRFFIAKRGEAPILFAEGDLPIEQTSLQTLADTIRSPRWYGEQPGKQKGVRQDRPPAQSTIHCTKCGAPVAPTAEHVVGCRFCGAAVAIREEVRQRVEAAAVLASTRRSGMAQLERLLVSQPSASFAGATMWLAALPILVAWPIAGALVLWDAYYSTFTVARGASLMVLPLLLTFGAFLQARGRLTDRFALHAVVVGFGARDPERPGEPYRCRACQAALPDVQGTPVVHCLYCNQANVLGLDLRGEARDAAEEQKSLESALRDRSRERWLWRFASLVSIGLFVAAFFIVRASVRSVGPVALTQGTDHPPTKIEVQRERRTLDPKIVYKSSSGNR
jgi:hypothetical protein